MSQPCFIRLHPGLHSRYLFQQYSTGPSDIFLTSNQLFGTLVRYWLQLHPSASQEEINRFATELHISSLFPGFQIFEEKTDVLFVPFPICPIHNENKLDVNSSGLHNHHDTAWNTQYHPAWISMHLLHFLKTFYDNGKLQLNDHFYSKARELFPGFWIHKDEVDLSSIPPLFETNYNYVEVSGRILRLQEKRCTLIPFFYFVSNTNIKEMESVLNFLLDQNLGGKKTVGFGSFDSWDHQQFSSIIQTHFQYNTISDSILLSNAIPSLEQPSAMVYWNICSSKGYGTLSEISEAGKPVSKHKQFYIQQGSIVKSNFTGLNISYNTSNTQANPYITYGKALLWEIGEN